MRQLIIRSKLAALLLAVLALFTVACTEEFWEELEESLNTTTTTEPSFLTYSLPTYRTTTTTSVQGEDLLLGEFFCVISISGSEQRRWQRDGGSTSDLIDLLENKHCSKWNIAERTYGRNYRDWLDREVFYWEHREFDEGVSVLLDLGEISPTPLQTEIGRDILYDIAWCLEGSICLPNFLKRP